MDEAFWRSAVNLDALLDAGMISPADLELFRYAADAESAWTCLVEQWLEQASAPTSAKPKDV